MRGADEASAATTRWPGLVVVLLAAAPLFVAAGSAPLNSDHEARVIETAREMLASGDWIVPRLNGEIRLQKPPLPYWVAAGLLARAQRADDGAESQPTSRSVGATAAQKSPDDQSVAFVRYGLAVFGIVALLGVWLTGTALYGPRVGMLATALCGGALIFIQEFRKVTPDPFLAAAVAVSVGAMAVAWRSVGRLRVFWTLVAWSALGVGLLAKGPIALLFVVLGAWAVAPSRRGVGVALVWHALGLLMAVAPIGAWAIAVAQRVPGGLAVIAGEMGKHVVSDGESTRPWYSYGIWLGVALLPTTLPLLPSLFAWRGRTRRLGQAFLAGVAVLAVLSSRKQSYLLPLIPLAVVMIAAWLEESARTASSGWRRASVLLQSVIALSAASAAFGGALVLWLNLRVEVLGWIAALGVIAAFAGGRILHPARRLTACAVMTVVAGALVGTVIEPHRNQEDLARVNVGRFLGRTVPRTESIAQVGLFEPVISYYADHGVRIFGAFGAWDADAAAPRWVVTDGVTYAAHRAIFGEPALMTAAADPKDVIVVARRGGLRRR